MTEKNLFRIPVVIPKSETLIELSDKILFMGSCFASNMGKLMEDARFPVNVNPFGVLYNPISIADTISSLLQPFDAGDLDFVFGNGLWHSFLHHGKFSQPTREKIINEINNCVQQTKSFLQKSDYLILTFGTAYVYEHKEKNYIVANCHKFNNNLFNRYMLEPEEIIDIYTDLIVNLRMFNPSLKIIMSVSPIRHLKDGAHGNQISKSVLLLATEKLTSRFEGVYYFPAYEIVMDELRDYRFYDSDMIQPNEMAVKYIWERFTDTYFSDETINYNREVQKIIKARNHRLSDFDIESTIQFINNALQQTEQLMSKYPHALLEQDREYFALLCNNN